MSDESVDPPTTTSVPPEPAVAHSLRRMRRAQARRLLLRVLIVVVLPTAIVALYLGVIASPQYESEAVFAIDSPDGSAVLYPIPGTHLPRDVKVAQEYALSRDMLGRLIDHQGFRDHYSSHDIDWLSRLRRPGNFERSYAYFREHVDAEYDPQTSFVTLRVRAFSGEAAHRFANAILTSTEEMITQEAQRVRQDRIAWAERDVDAAMARLATVQREIAQLERERANDAANDEASVPRTAGGDAPRGEAAPPADPAPDAPAGGSEAEEDVETRLAQANVRRDLAMRTFEVALDQVETARTEAARAHRYVVHVTRPSQPDVATHPKVLRTVFTGFLASALILVIGSLLLAAVREHAQF